MIGDLCKPLNEGESNTVRIIMNVHEARRWLRGDVHAQHDLQSIIERAIEEEDRK